MAPSTLATTNDDSHHHCSSTSCAAFCEPIHEEEEEVQVLVKLDNATTYLLHVPRRRQHAQPLETAILHQLSLQTKWPVGRLRLLQTPAVFEETTYFLSAVTLGFLRGGKGGFGTLLKGQSKQAGAKQTVDFGACRDLQGRRLRHVNDEVKLRKWREAQHARSQGLEVDEVSLLQTSSGIRNWHLNVPHWAQEAGATSNKAKRRAQRQLQREVGTWQQEEIRKQQAQKEKEARFRQGVTTYVQQAEQPVMDDMSGAIAQGLLQQKKKEKQQLPVKRKWKQDASFSSSNNNNDYGYLCTLSGEVVVQDDDNGSKSKILQIQSQSDFCTAALFVDYPQEEKRSLYFEVTIVSGGLAQVGWACLEAPSFHPNNDTGDGVGDDAGSYAYDGSRGLKFHDGKEEAYGNNEWKEGDVIGCRYNVAAGGGDISYYHNGVDLGIAFTIPPEKQQQPLLMPAVSCNQGEILGLCVGPEFAHLPKDCVGVHEWLLLESDNKEAADAAADAKRARAAEVREETTKVTTAGKEEATTAAEDSLPVPPKEAPTTLAATPTTQKDAKPSKPAITKIEPLDLDAFQSVDELTELGLDRLKGALLALGAKCGGSLEERAARLFSLKGLKREDYPMKVRGKNFVV